MLLWKSGDRARFRIDGISDVQDMQRTIRDFPHTALDTRYVAAELASNIAKAGEKGEIEVNGSEVISEIDTTMGPAIAQKIDTAQQAVDEKQNGKILERSKERGGFGFISILENGWGLKCQHDARVTRITARRSAPACAVPAVGGA
jgi:hypothetical protein